MAGMLVRYLFPLISAVLFLPQCASSYLVRETGIKGNVTGRYVVKKDIIFTPPLWPAPVMGDLYQPVGAKAAPAILLIHGGGWTGSDGRWQMVPIAKQLVKRGYVVFNVTYRLAPRWLYPAPVDDLREAVKWMRSHAAEQGIDPERVAVFGYSAGGHLAALTGFNQELKLRAIVAGGTPSDLYLFPGGDLVPQFLGGTRQEIPQRFREASPVNHITSSSPPVFIYHGGADKLVPPEHAWAFSAALAKHHVEHELFWLPHRDHIPAFLLPGRSVVGAMNFLDRHLLQRQ